VLEGLNHLCLHAWQDVWSQSLFDPEILDKVRALAKQKGAPYQTLVQMWVAEKVQESSEVYK
jgi:hypothetical protein